MKSPNPRTLAGLPLEPGTVIGGRYRVESVLGIGGMGVVVTAQHLSLDERVAIKFLLGEAAGDAEAVRRFAREAWAASRVKSEYVARVNDIGTLDDGMPFMVMEYLDGLDLAHMLRDRGPLPIGQAVEFMLQACEAIAEAHAFGVVHRDLKPSNLFCVKRSDGLLAIKVLDFGISKLTQSFSDGMEAHSITNTAKLMGSPLYMSPEQMSSAKTVDARADVWSLGVILHELIAGRVPFAAATLPELAIKIATESVGSLRTTRSDVPKGLERVVARCLEKDRNRRYENVAELAEALVPFGPPRAHWHAERAERVLRTARQTGAIPQVAPVPAPAGDAFVTTAVRRRLAARPSPRALVLALAVVAVLAALLIRSRSLLDSSSAPAAASSVASERRSPESAAAESRVSAARDVKAPAATAPGAASPGSAPAPAAVRPGGTRARSTPPTTTAALAAPSTPAAPPTVGAVTGDATREPGPAPSAAPARASSTRSAPKPAPAARPVKQPERPAQAVRPPATAPATAPAGKRAPATEAAPPRVAPTRPQPTPNLSDLGGRI